MSLSARVIRADGRVEELGEVAYWHRNPFKRFAWRVSRLMRALRPTSTNPTDRTRYG